MKLIGMKVLEDSGEAGDLRIAEICGWLMRSGRTDVYVWGEKRPFSVGFGMKVARPGDWVVRRPDGEFVVTRKEQMESVDEG